MELTPAQRAERDRYYQGARILDGINTARAQTGEEPIKLDWSQAPESVKAERKEARDRAEAAQIDERTRELELETARLEGEIKGRTAA